MILSQSLQIIEELQGDIDDKILLGEEPCPPDRYFQAVGAALPYLKCFNWAMQAFGNGSDCIADSLQMRER